MPFSTSSRLEGFTTSGLRSLASLGLAGALIGWVPGLVLAEEAPTAAVQPPAADPVEANPVVANPVVASPVAADPALQDAGAPDSAAPDSAAPDSGASAEVKSDTSSPTFVVETLHDGLLSVMKEATKLGYDGRYERLEPLIRGAYDTQFMASKAAGRHWRDLSPEDQTRWVDVFRRLTIATYADRFEGFSDQSFVTLGQEDSAAGTVAVRTKLVDPTGDDVQLSYRLRSSDEGWRIIDVYMHGTVSELALRRAEYGSALDREGFESVMSGLNEKIASYSAPSAD